MLHQGTVQLYSLSCQGVAMVATRAGRVVELKAMGFAK